MIADTSFLIDFAQEILRREIGPARAFFAQNRSAAIRTTIITVGEIAVGFPSAAQAWLFFRAWQIYPLNRGIAETSADLERELRLAGARLGENDNWIAGFSRYYREPLISRDADFDRVRGLRRIAY